VASCNGGPHENTACQIRHEVHNRHHVDRILDPAAARVCGQGADGPAPRSAVVAGVALLSPRPTTVLTLVDRSASLPRPPRRFHAASLLLSRPTWHPAAAAAVAGDLAPRLSLTAPAPVACGWEPVAAVERRRPRGRCWGERLPAVGGACPAIGGLAFRGLRLQVRLAPSGGVAGGGACRAAADGPLGRGGGAHAPP